MHQNFPVRVSHRLPHRAAFTLIELLTVMAIIVLLAALILGIANHANYKAALSRANTEIRAFEGGIENYKIDNGTAPRDASSPSVTDTLNPQTDFDPANGSKYKDASHYLYMALSGFQPGTNFAVGTYSPSKQYLTFQPNQLEIYNTGGTDKVKNPGSPNMYIVDPFGFSYGYSTAYQYQKDQADNSATPGATPTPGFGYNPTFDIWSTAGFSRSGKGTPTSNANASPSAIYSSLWLKNW